MERAAEACAAAMAGVLPFDAVIRVLNPIVKTGEYPVNQAAVKMLTKVAEHKDSKDVIISHLADIMPGLLRVSEAKPYCVLHTSAKIIILSKSSHFENFIFDKIHVSKTSLHC